MSYFKEGDWIVITGSKINWDSDMNSFIGQVVQITQIRKGGSIIFEGSGSWVWNFIQGHFRRALPEEIPGYVGEPNYEIY